MFSSFSLQIVSLFLGVKVDIHSNNQISIKISVLYHNFLDPRIYFSIKNSRLNSATTEAKPSRITFITHIKTFPTAFLLLWQKLSITHWCRIMLINHFCILPAIILYNKTLGMSIQYPYPYVGCIFCYIKDWEITAIYLHMQVSKHQIQYNLYVDFLK